MGTENTSIEATTKVADCTRPWVGLLSCTFIIFCSQIPIAIAGIFYLEFTDEISGYETMILWASSLAANLLYFLGKILPVFNGLYDAFF